MSQVQPRIFPVRLRSFDTTTAQGRAQERTRRSALTAAASAGAKGIGFLASLISLPLTVPYLGSERYGLWVMISSMLALLSFADLGIGSGLLNAVSGALGRNDRPAVARYVSSAFFLLSSIAACLLVLFAAVYAFVDWPSVLHVTSARASAEAGPAMAVLVCCFALNLPLDIVQRVQAGFQEGFESNLWQIVGSLLGLGGVLAAIHFRAGLPFLIAGMAGTPLLAVLLNNLHQFGLRRPELRPRFRLVNRAACRVVMGSGLQLLTAQVGAAAIQAAPILLTGALFGAAHSAKLGVALKFLGLPGLFCGFWWLALWPAYGEAYARGDGEWIARTVRRSTRGVALLLLIVLPPMAFLTPWIAHYWTRGRVEIGLPVALACALLLTMTALRGVLSMPVAGCGRLRRPAVVLPVAALSTAAILLLPRAALTTYEIPLWIAACEAVVVVFLAADTRAILREIRH